MTKAKKRTNEDKAAATDSKVSNVTAADDEAWELDEEDEARLRYLIEKDD